MLRRLEARDVSLDAKPFDGSTTTLGDLLVASDNDQEVTLSTSEFDGRVRDAVKSAIAGLDERERYIAEKRLMADSEDELSLGRELGHRRHDDTAGRRTWTCPSKRMASHQGDSDNPGRSHREAPAD